MKNRLIRERNLSDILHYIIGNLRYRLYYSSLYVLIPSHIRQQIEARVKSMKPECYALGSCILCGCRTTELQMSNKKCEGGCYPRMMNRILWKNMKLGGIYFSKSGDTKWQLCDGKFIQI